MVFGFRTHSEGCRESSRSHTHLWHMILQTPQVFHSDVCRQPAAGNTHSGSSPHWNHTQARSHCCTGEHTNVSLWLVLESANLRVLNRTNHLQKKKHWCLFSMILIVSIKSLTLQGHH